MRSGAAAFMRLTLLVFTIIACEGFAFSQNGTILGTVFDGAGATMPGVIVHVENKATGFIKTTTTTQEGSFVISGVPPADGYVIVASLPDGRDIDRRGNISINVG